MKEQILVCFLAGLIAFTACAEHLFRCVSAAVRKDDEAVRDSILEIIGFVFTWAMFVIIVLSIKNVSLIAAAIAAMIAGYIECKLAGLFLRAFRGQLPSVEIS